MNNVLSKVKKIQGECCVTIVLNTHRTLPDNEKDPILLKNLIREAANRLPEACSEQAAAALVDKLHKLAGEIDHRHNLESLALFVNKDIAEYTRMPIHIENRVVIGETFATRDLFRALNEEKSYFVLVLGRDQARLIEAFNDRVIKEHTGDFPLINTFLDPMQDNSAPLGDHGLVLQREFLNDVDKKLQEILKQDSRRALICAEESTYHHFMKEADRKEFYMGHLPGNRMHEKAQHIILEVWPTVLQIRKEALRARTEELEKAQGAGQVLTDINDIWRAVNEGRGRIVFVQKGFIQPARLVNGTVELASPMDGEAADRNGLVDDIIDDIVEVTFQNGGDVVFASEGDLAKYNGLALITRY